MFNLDTNVHISVTGGHGYVTRRHGRPVGVRQPAWRVLPPPRHQTSRGPSHGAQARRHQGLCGEWLTDSYSTDYFQANYGHNWPNFNFPYTYQNRLNISQCSVSKIQAHLGVKSQISVYVCPVMSQQGKHYQQVDCLSMAAILVAGARFTSLYKWLTMSLSQITCRGKTLP